MKTFPIGHINVSIIKILIKCNINFKCARFVFLKVHQIIQNNKLQNCIKFPLIYAGNKTIVSETYKTSLRVLCYIERYINFALVNQVYKK